MVVGVTAAAILAARLRPRLSKGRGPLVISGVGLRRLAGLPDSLRESMRQAANCDRVKRGLYRDGDCLRSAKAVMALCQGLTDCAHYPAVMGTIVSPTLAVFPTLTRGCASPVTRIPPAVAIGRLSSLAKMVFDFGGPRFVPNFVKTSVHLITAVAGRATQHCSP